jgi:hypothetical protein
MIKRSIIPVIGWTITATMFIAGCKKNDSGPGTSYTVPATYNFSNADSLPAKTILSMFGEMEIALNKGNAGNVVSSANMKSMYANQGGLFTDTSFNGVTINLNTSGMSLENSTIPAARTLIASWIDSIELASSSTLPATNGVAGVSSRQTLLSQNGIYWRQLFTKTQMGTVLGHLITDVYLGDSLNSNISMTAKQHAWDQAFFLWCVPSNFPANRKGVKYWGSYTSQIDSGISKPVTTLTGINANPALLNAFLKGRAALANNDNSTALQQAAVIIPFFETLEAAAALHELNEAKGNLANSAAAVTGNLSESLGFWMALKFNQHKKISESDYQSVLALYGTNLWNFTPESIDAILNKISSIYGWDAVKSNL